MIQKIKIVINLNFLFFLIIYYNYHNIYNTFEHEINRIYNNFYKVNINEIENKIKQNNNFQPEQIKSIINIGFTLDKNYVLETMLTISSILSTQKNTTKVRFHFGVTEQFTPNTMIKMYELKKKINNLSEFNFYYLKESIEKMKNFHPKGEACPGKFELPHLLPEDVERLIIFDAGDLLVLRDLTEMYNYDMKDYWVLGTPEPSIINSFMKEKYNMTKYLNIGSILLDIKKFKTNNFWKYYIDNRNLTLEGQPDQTLFNILISDENKNYLPFKFGGFSLFNNDKNYDLMLFENFQFKNWLKSNYSISLPEKPESEKDIIFYLYNPRFIHQFDGKWEKGDGLSIYRLLAKYFINIAGISDEICKKKPGYCK